MKAAGASEEKKAFGGFAVKKQVGLLAAQMYLCLDGDWKTKI